MRCKPCPPALMELDQPARIVEAVFAKLFGHGSGTQRYRRHENPQDTRWTAGLPLPIADANSDQGNGRGDHAPDRKHPGKSNHQSTHRCKSVTVDCASDHRFTLILAGQRRSRGSPEQQARDLLLIKDGLVVTIESFEFAGHRFVLKGAKSILRVVHDRLAHLLLAAMLPYSARWRPLAAPLAEFVIAASFSAPLRRSASEPPTDLLLAEGSWSRGRKIFSKPCPTSLHRNDEEKSF